MLCRVRTRSLDRFLLLLTLTLIAFIATVGLGSIARAHEATPAAGKAETTDFSAHPLAGVWSVMVEGETVPDQVDFTDDGGYIDVDGDGVVVIGAWEPSGENTATMTFTTYDEDGGLTVRATIELSEDGQSFTGTATVELLDRSTGEGRGQYGPLALSATRVVIEAPGTPVGTIDELWAQVKGEAEATPIP